jgi:hypothetical protein
MSRRFWTANEDGLLRTMAVDSNSDAIAEALGRSRDSVKHRARHLGVSLQKHGERCPHAKYSDAVCEAARRAHEAGKKPKQIAAELNIPYSACCDFVYFKRGYFPQASHR